MVDFPAPERPARPQVKATVGGRAPSHLGMDALLDFRMEVTLDGESLSAAEIKKLLSQSEGLAFIRGKWVEVDHKRLSRALEQFEPRRYKRLTWGENSAVDDGITFDIAAQVGALFKRGGPHSPLHGLKVRHVFEAGFSQDGAFTFTQADVFNALDRLPDGGPVYDGYVPGGTVGPSDINFGLTAAGALASGSATGGGVGVPSYGAASYGYG